jgi:hypothetical protein
LVKLNRRHKAYRDLRHQWAFRWDSYDTKTCSKVKKIFYDMYGSQYDWSNRIQANHHWEGVFGSKVPGHSYRTYWINFRNEHDATVALLKMEHM